MKKIEDNTTKLSPKEADTTERLCMLQRDNKDFGDYWILVQENMVSIGQRHHETINIPKPEFERMIKFYETPQKVVSPNPINEHS